MNLNKINLLYIYLFLPVVLFTATIGSADQVNAIVDRNKISRGESITLSVVMDQKAQEIDTSAITGFKVIPRGSSTKMSIVNFKTSRQIVQSYLLVPLKIGKLRIPPLKIIMDDITLYTKMISVDVIPEPDNGSQTRDVFISGAVSNKAPYVGEQITYAFTFARAVQVANPRIINLSFTGFTTKQTGDEKSFNKIINGRTYLFTRITYLLIPLTSGPIQISPLELTCDLPRKNKQGGQGSTDPFFNNSFFTTSFKKISLRTEQFEINVKPLPLFTEKDTSFSGLVGYFNINASVDQDAFSAGESTTLSVIVKGIGNVLDAPAPKITLPEQFKIYKDSPVDEITLSDDGYRGKRTFKYALVPIKEGTFILPPVKLNYFDITAKKYRSLSTKPITIIASPSTEKATEDNTLSPENFRKSRRSVEFTGRDILPIKKDLDSVENKEKIPLYLFVLMILIPPSLYLVGVLFVSFSGRSSSAAELMSKRSRKALKNAQDDGCSQDQFLSSLFTAFISAVYSRQGIRGESLTLKETRNILSSNGVPERIIKPAIALFETIETSRYSGAVMGTESRKELLVQTKSIIRSFSK